MSEVWAQIVDGSVFKVWILRRQQRHISILIAPRRWRSRGMSVSSEFQCVCGKTAGWITDGEVKKNPCPECGRKYRGEYNAETLTIDAVEVED